MTGWSRLRRALSRSADPRKHSTASDSDGSEPMPGINEDNEEDLDRHGGNNAWLFAAEKEAPCCLNCGKRFSMRVTR